MYVRALDLVALCRRKVPDTPGLAFGEAAALAALGRTADVSGVIDKVIREFGADRQGLRVIYLVEHIGQELAAHGHGLEARAAYDRAIAWANARPAEQQSTRESRKALAGVLNSAGRWNEATVLYRELSTADTNDPEVQAALGDLAARRGDQAEAERIGSWLEAEGHTRLHGASSEYRALYQRARIAGLLGDPKRAISLLREAAQLGFADWLDAHRDPDLAPLRSDPGFQEWIRAKD
jgi:tetratricopeptide (TPR) repeat protein